VPRESIWVSVGAIGDREDLVVKLSYLEA
jgi:hypothetical protein